MRIVHLAYEDPAQPGSGGGSVRTREINRRLAARHSITALVAGYPGARERVEDGVRWVPLWPRSGSKLDRLAYFGLIGPALRRYPHDLVVEDFGAPFSVGLAPWWTKQPVVASVQWLFAREMRQKYGLPFDWVERTGLRWYDDFIAVSDWLAATLRTARPAAHVETVPNGIEPLAFATAPAAPAHFVFVGRLDIAQKGCDLLLASLAIARQQFPDLPRLIFVGDGPDQPQLEAQAAALGVRDLIEFRGRVNGAAKYALMTEAYAVLMPSRWETFGMVAVEAQAAGAPVIAYDTGPLREVAGGGGATLIAPFDTAAFAAAMIDAVHEASAWQDRRSQGRAWATRYDWDQLALQQEAHYLRALTRHTL